ncbi:MAG: hypothetical protein N4A43_00640 [Alphaproteobacteria bacterium]|nr:hypothetical protein [Alphaproteobacteria bacterium]
MENKTNKKAEEDRKNKEIRRKSIGWGNGLKCKKDTKARPKSIFS